MCYYSSISVGFKIIEDRFGARFVQTESFIPVFSASAFTFPSLPVISNEDARQIVFMHWGLIPFWVTVQSMLAPYNMQEMEAYPVAGMVNKLGFNVTHPEVTTRHAYPDLPELTLNEQMLSS